MMKNQQQYISVAQETPKTTNKPTLPPKQQPEHHEHENAQYEHEKWSDDTRILDMDYFVKTIMGIKSKGVRPDLVGSIIAHYSSKWLPDLSSSSATTTTASTTGTEDIYDDDVVDETDTTARWMKKRFFVETLVGILPKEIGAVSCNFLLRLLRVAGSTHIDRQYCGQLEILIGPQLDQADLKDLLIPIPVPVPVPVPSFCGGGGGGAAPQGSTCSSTLLDVDLVIRLVRRFLQTTSSTDGPTAARLAKVARLVDSYLTEAALDSNLGLGEFIDLAGSLPAHARVSDDGLYRAIDTYLKAHPNMTKQERKLLCRLIDSRKLSPEASLHASHNDRLPVRAVLQVLFSEQIKLARQLDWSGPLLSGAAGGGFRSSPLSTTTATTTTTAMSAALGGPAAAGLDQYQLPVRCLSKRELIIPTQQQLAEIRKLKEDLLRLQSQYNAMQIQMERFMSIKKRSSTTTSKGFFTKWRKIGLISSFRTTGNSKDTNGTIKYNISDHLSEEYYSCSGHVNANGRDNILPLGDQLDQVRLNNDLLGFGFTGRQPTPTSTTKTKKRTSTTTTPNKWRNSMS